MAYCMDRKMSLRACIAYDRNDEKKITDFGKADRDYLVERLERCGFNVGSVSVPQMRRWLKEQGESSWHHTGENYRRTSFFSIEYALIGMIGTNRDEDILDDFVQALIDAA